MQKYHYKIIALFIMAVFAIFLVVFEKQKVPKNVRLAKVKIKNVKSILKQDPRFKSVKLSTRTESGVVWIDVYQSLPMRDEDGEELIKIILRTDPQVRVGIHGPTSFDGTGSDAFERNLQKRMGSNLE